MVYDVDAADSLCRSNLVSPSSSLIAGKHGGVLVLLIIVVVIPIDKLSVCGFVVRRRNPFLRHNAR